MKVARQTRQPGLWLTEKMWNITPYSLSVGSTLWPLSKKDSIGKGKQKITSW